MISQRRSRLRGTSKQKSIDAIAAVAAVWGDWRLTRQHDLKRVVPVYEICKILLLHREAEPTAEREVLELVQDFASLSINERLNREKLIASSSEAAREAAAHALAGGLVALLRWWLENEARETPAEIDDLFHRTVWHGLNTELKDRPTPP